MTTSEAAKALGLTTASRVVQLIKDGRLPASKRGRDWHIREAALEKLKQDWPRKAGRKKGKKP